MKILAIDTSNHPMTVALVEDEKLLATTTLNMVRNHSIYLLPVIDDLCQKVDWQPKDLERVVVAKGPGSYTGIRIAVTSAKVLADTLGIELVGVSSLKVIAANVMPSQTALIVPFFDARRGNVFAGVYQWQKGQLKTVLADQHFTMADLLAKLNELDQKTLLLGDVTPKLADYLTDLADNLVLMPPACSLPSAYQLALLGQNETPITNLADFVPAYLRITEAEATWQKQNPTAKAQEYVREV